MKKIVCILALIPLCNIAFSDSKLYSDQELLQMYLAAGGSASDLYEESSTPSWDSSDFGDYGGSYDIPTFEDKKKKEGSSTIHRTSDKVRQLAEKIPNEAIRDGLNTYLDIIGAENYGSDGEVGTSNAGVGAHHENVLSDNNMCFGSMVKEFYDDILKIDAKDESPRRPNLLMESGKGKFKDLKPGWLWDKALKQAGGNSNLAMRLIGICGHDDVAQGKYQSKVDLTNPKKKEEYLKSKLSLDIPINASSYEKQYLIKNYIAEKKRIMALTSAPIHINCPSQKSSFYLSNALGKGVSIGDRLKNRIINTQGKTAGASNISSKNYHIMGAAYMSCRLVEEGIHPKLATQIQKSAAWAYRTIRISTAIKDDLEEGKWQEALFKKLKSNSNSSLSKDDFLWKLASDYHKKARDAKCDYKDPLVVDGVEFTCFDGARVVSKMRLAKEGADSLSKDRFTRVSTKIDAAMIFDKRFVGGDNGIPHTNYIPSWNMDTGTITIPSYTTGGSEMKVKAYRSQPLGWTTKRYKRALDKIETYLVDWDWTVKQHEIGARFAAERCKQTKYGDNIDEVACKAYEDRNSKCDRQAFETDDGLSKIMKVMNSVISAF